MSLFMPKQLKIAFIASECSPFAKTGGLADVVGALPGALKKLGHEVIIIMPLYKSVDRKRYQTQPLSSPLGGLMGDIEEWCGVHSTTNDDGVEVFFIEFSKYFERDGLYHDSEYNDFLDNPRRFALISKAALQLCKVMGFKIDIVHTHDWQTALSCAYLKIWDWDDPVVSGAASILTIHNIGYQGKYPAEHYEYTGLQDRNFTSDKFEDHGGMNFLKGGIHYADFITTVSPKYALETRTPEGGQGMAPYLNDKRDRYVGILNGVDYSIWNPAIDPLIPSNYTADDLKGKMLCKRILQKRLNLKPVDGIPLIGVVSRFAHQKGLDVLADAIEDILQNMVVQFAILGSGDKDLETFFGDLAIRYPGDVGCYIGYSNELAHWIEAGTDFFVMPSRYEPCGLNQIYSLKYGSLPIVHATGGLDDTVEQYNETSGSGEGTGFKFWEMSSHAVYYAIGWAVSTYFDRPAHIQKMQQKGMMQVFSWERSALSYLEVYEEAIKIKKALQ
jgi:starch synthase